MNELNDTNNSDLYYHKYMKYRDKYYKLLNQMGGKEQCTGSNCNDTSCDVCGGIDKKLSDKHRGKNKGKRWNCDPTKNFANICAEVDEGGKYTAKNKCVNDCIKKYINHNLISAKLKRETVQFTLLMKKLFDEHMHIYIKGGTVLGLKVLKMVYNRYGESNKFKKYFDEFMELGLVRDWDFVAYSERDITDEYRDYLDETAAEYGLVPRAKTFILYQTKRPIQLDDQALFEIAILDGDALSSLELPMTTIKVKVRKNTLPYVYMLAKCFSSNKLHGIPFDLDIIKYIMQDMRFVIYPHDTQGLFSTTEHFDTGTLTKDMLDFIERYADTRKSHFESKNLQQFLITHIMEPNRMYYRLLVKNIPKAQKIRDFLRDAHIATNKPSWLLDGELVFKDLVPDFTTKFSDHLVERYKQKGIDGINELVSGINWSRIQIEWEKMNDYGRYLIKILLKPLSDVIDPSQMPSIDTTNPVDRISVWNLLKFLATNADFIKKD